MLPDPDRGGDVNIDLTKPGPDARLKDPEIVKIKERGAKHLADVFFSLFRNTLAGFFVLAIAISLRFSSPDDIAKVVTEALIPLIQQASDFALKVFVPLSAFVLGHYFGRGDSKRA